MLNFIKQNKVIIVAILIYFILFSFLSIWRHNTFQTQVWDMAAFEQSFWNTLQGNFMFNNFEGTNHFAIHFSPFLLLLIPFYALWQGPEMLLILQSFALAIAALPLYLLAKNMLSQKWATIIALMYLFYPSLHWINLFDFHAVAFAIPLFITFFYYLERRNYTIALVFLALASTTAENMIVAVFFVGVFLFFYSRRLFGAAIATISLVWFILVAKVIMPAFGGGIIRLDRYEQFGETASEIVKNVIINPGLTAQTVLIPEKFNYLLNIFLSAAFIPLSSITSLILLIPGLLQNLLTNFSIQFENFYQYDSILVPFISIGIIFGLKNILKKGLSENIIITGITILVATGFILNSPLSPFNFPVQKFTTSRTQDFKNILKLIPDDASVAAYTNLVPHMTHREHIYMAGREPILVDYVILDGNDLFGFPNQEAVDDYLDIYAAQDKHEILIVEDRYYILRPK